MSKVKMMQNEAELENAIFSINSDAQFEQLALSVFRFQYEKVEVYRQYCDLLNIRSESIKKLEDIPFLPIQFFKNYTVIAEGLEPEKIFKSSGTGGNRSQHKVAKLTLYERSFLNCFEAFYGAVEDHTVFALLPSYLEQGDSSLVYMCDQLIKRSRKANSGFFLYDHSKLSAELEKQKTQASKTLLIGVSYALLDFSKEFPGLDFPELTIMETGGMKGRKREMIRSELHEELNRQFGSKSIHSEYGMTELLSQAYSKGNGLFACPNWMKVLIRKQEDPFQWVGSNESGGINVIDLANLYSCSFIQTDDLGRLDGKGIFEVLGRFDQSEVRGCNQMATSSYS